MSAEWTMQEDGTCIGMASPRAMEWADGSDHKLASVCFVAWLRDMDVPSVWKADAYDEVEVAANWGIKVLLDSSADPASFRVEERAVFDRSYAIVRIIPTSPLPVIHILGITGTLEQIQRDTEPYSLSRLQPLGWFLSAFPAHRKGVAA